MIQSYFGDIRQIIVENLKKARHDIYVAVAWITDKQLMQILSQKLIEGIDVKIVLVPDDINTNNGFDYKDFVKKGGLIYWDNHHHKFCVIDRKTVITGSYNWTYAAHNRVSRENVLVINNEEELIENYAAEFRLLIKQASKFTVPEDIKVVVKEKEVIRYVDRPIETIVEKVIEKPVVKVVNTGKPIIKYVEKPIEKIIEKEINKGEKVAIQTFTLYEKRGKYMCGKCHSDKINTKPKAPKNIEKLVSFYCDNCNTYFDKSKNSL